MVTELIRKRRRGKPVRRTFELAAVTGSISSPGAAAVLTVRLPHAAISGLERGARESSTFAVTASNANGTAEASARIARIGAKG